MARLPGDCRAGRRLVVTGVRFDPAPVARALVGDSRAGPARAALLSGWTRARGCELVRRLEKRTATGRNSAGDGAQRARRRAKRFSFWNGTHERNEWRITITP